MALLAAPTLTHLVTPWSLLVNPNPMSTPLPLQIPTQLISLIKTLWPRVLTPRHPTKVISVGRLPLTLPVSLVCLVPSWASIVETLEARCLQLVPTLWHLRRATLLLP